MLFPKSVLVCLLFYYFFGSCKLQVRNIENLNFSNSKNKKIFILLSEQVSSFETVHTSFKEELNGTYEFLSLNLEGEYQDLNKIPNSIQKLKPDLILCIGSKALEAVVGKIQNTPILFSMVLDYKKLNIENYPNLAGVSLQIPAEMIFYNFRNYFEDTKNFAVMSHKDFIKQIEQEKIKLVNYDIQLSIVETNDPSEVPNKYQKFKNKVEGLWMTPDPNVISEESFLYLVDKTIQDKKNFIVFSEKFVEAGALFSTSPNYSTIGSQLAIKTRQILEDKEPPSKVGISPIIGTFITINKTTLKKLGKKISFEGIDKIYE